MTIKEILREIVLGSDSSNAIAGINFMATVESVDAKKYTCSVKLLGGNGILEDVRLKAENEKDYGVVSIPEKGSFVVVSVLGSEAGAYISLCSKLQKIEVKIDSQTLDIDKNGFVFNGGKNNGLLKIDDVVDWMSKVHNDLTTLQTQLSTHPVAGQGAALGLVFNSSTPSPTNVMFEDNKVKH